METEKKSDLGQLLAEKKLTPKAIKALIVLTLAIALPFYHLFTAYFGQPQAEVHRSFFLSVVMVLVFLTHPLRRFPAPGRFNPFFCSTPYLPS